jgi:hypothetical protein
VFANELQAGPDAAFCCFGGVAVFLATLMLRMDRYMAPKMRMPVRPEVDSKGAVLFKK